MLSELTSFQREALRFLQQYFQDNDGQLRSYGREGTIREPYGFGNFQVMLHWLRGLASREQQTQILEQAPPPRRIALPSELLIVLTGIIGQSLEEQTSTVASRLSASRKTEASGQAASPSDNPLQGLRQTWRSIRKNYKQLTSESVVDYDALVAIAYTLGSTLAHAGLLHHVFASVLPNHTRVPLAEREEWEVAILAGGSGAEIIGLATYLQSVYKGGEVSDGSSGSSKKKRLSDIVLKVIVYDHLPSWGGTLAATVDAVQAFLDASTGQGRRRIKVELDFQVTDLLTNGEAVQATISTCDLVVLSYAYGEMFLANHDQCTSFLENHVFLALGNEETDRLFIVVDPVSLQDYRRIEKKFDHMMRCARNVTVAMSEELKSSLPAEAVSSSPLQPVIEQTGFKIGGDVKLACHTWVRVITACEPRDISMVSVEPEQRVNMPRITILAPRQRLADWRLNMEQTGAETVVAISRRMGDPNYLEDATHATSLGVDTWKKEGGILLCEYRTVSKLIAVLDNPKKPRCHETFHAISQSELVVCDGAEYILDDSGSKEASHMKLVEILSRDSSPALLYNFTNASQREAVRTVCERLAQSVSTTLHVPPVAVSSPCLERSSESLLGAAYATGLAIDFTDVTESTCMDVITDHLERNHKVLFFVSPRYYSEWRTRVHDALPQRAILDLTITQAGGSTRETRRCESANFDVCLVNMKDGHTALPLPSTFQAVIVDCRKFVTLTQRRGLEYQLIEKVAHDTRLHWYELFTDNENMGGSTK